MNMLTRSHSDPEALEQLSWTALMGTVRPDAIHYSIIDATWHIHRLNMKILYTLSFMHGGREQVWAQEWDQLWSCPIPPHSPPLAELIFWHRECLLRPRLREGTMCPATHPENDNGMMGRWINGQFEDASGKDWLQWGAIGGHIHLRPPQSILFKVYSNISYCQAWKLEDHHMQPGPPHQGIFQAKAVNSFHSNTDPSDADPRSHPHTDTPCPCTFTRADQAWDTHLL